MTELQPGYRRELLHQSAQDRVKQFIIDHGYGAGDPLPPEAELARQIGVSRPSLREAMRVLQTIGVVEARHGVGTFVGHPSFDAFTNGLVFQIDVENRQDENRIARNLNELVAIREALESAVVARMAGKYPDDDIAELYRLTERMEASAAKGEMFAGDDWAFHEVLYRPTGNRLLLRLLQAFWTVSDRVRQTIPSPEQLQLTARHHRDLVDALAAGDGIAAAEAMRVHFSGILTWFDERGENSGLIGYPNTSLASGSKPDDEVSR